MGEGGRHACSPGQLRGARAANFSDSSRALSEVAAPTRDGRPRATWMPEISSTRNAKLDAASDVGRIRLTLLMRCHQRSLNTAEAGALNISRSKIALRASPVTRPHAKRVYTLIALIFHRYYAGPSSRRYAHTAPSHPVAPSSGGGPRSIPVSAIDGRAPRDE